MNDKEIRQILIAYLRAENQDCRIFEEKNIGDSICDVMMVTDKLTGFEIKGDSDDRRRLKSQVQDYIFCLTKVDIANRI